jgi:adenosylcobinamide-GDP ribazoletransferase
LLLRVTLLARLGPAAPWALVGTECLSRTAPIWLMTALPYVSQDEASKSRQVTRGGFPQAALATLWPAVLLVGCWSAGVFSAPRVGCLVGAAAAVALLTGWRYRVRAGGITGDFLGATQQIGVCALLAVLAAEGGQF